MNQIENTVVDTTVVENTVVKNTVVETAETAKPAPKKRAPKKQPVVVETNVETTDAETTETAKPAPKKRAPKKQPVVVETNVETTDAETAETAKPAPKKRAPKKQPVVVETNVETTDAETAETAKPAPKKRAPKKVVSEDQFNITYGTSFNKEEIDHINWLTTVFNVHINIAIKYVQENSLCETKPNDDFCCRTHKKTFQSSLENSEEVNLKAEHLLIIGETNGAIFSRKKAKKEWEKTAKWGPEEEKKYWANQMSVEDIGKCLGYLVSIGFLNKLDWSHM